jgi:hypothetical protein
LVRRGPERVPPEHLECFEASGSVTVSARAVLKLLSPAEFFQPAE